jgi:hypothetical protein
MSYVLIFMKFEDGDSVGFNKDRLKAILVRHMCEIKENSDGSSLVDFPLNGDSGTIGSEGSIFYHEGFAESFNIDRPYHDLSLHALWYDLMSELGVCCFPDFGGEIFATSDILSDIPEGLLGHCDTGLTIINTVSDLR